MWTVPMAAGRCPGTLLFLTAATISGNVVLSNPQLLPYRVYERAL